MWKVSLEERHLLTLQDTLEDTILDKLHENWIALEKTSHIVCSWPSSQKKI